MPSRSASSSHEVKRFPPGRRNIQVPTSSRAAALAALALYAPCVPRGYAVRDAAWALVRLLGPRALPGSARPLQPSTDEVTWRSLLESWGEELGPFTDLAVYGRIQAERAGGAVLLLDGPRSVAFLRVEPHAADRFAREARVLEGLAAAPRSFWHPVVLSSGEVGDLAWLAVSAMTPRPHRAQRTLPAEVLADVGEALAGVLPRPAGIPETWTPMHGDLAPWNLRSVGRGARALIDWEDAAWGPPQADQVLFDAAAAALWGGPVPHGPPEAVAFWRERIARRHAAAPAPLSADLLGALGRMSGAGLP